MSGHRLGADFEKAFGAGVLTVPDPGNTGTFEIPHSHCIASVTSAGVETRSLPAAAAFPVGTEFTVYGDTLAGAVTVGGVALGTAKDNARFIVVTAAGVKAWHTLSTSVA